MTIPYRTNQVVGCASRRSRTPPALGMIRRRADPEPEAGTLHFDARPSTVATMLRAFVPSPGFDGRSSFPRLGARWTHRDPDRRHLAAYLRLSGLPEEGAIPIVYPHVFGFPLLMAVLTQPRFPIPIWQVLQVRNSFFMHRAISTMVALDVESRVACSRVLDRGAEVDLHTTLEQRGETVWESITTFYFRGRFGDPAQPHPRAVAPEIDAPVLSTWRAPRAGGWTFGGLTGDYNGIHWWSAYARRFGFRRALLHPQLSLGQCLARLSRPAPSVTSWPQMLEVWIKGPVYYGHELTLRGTERGGAKTFGLFVEGEDRPALVGRLSSGWSARAALE